MNPPVENIPRVRRRHLYREAELYKAAMLVCTKPFFHCRKAQNILAGGKTLYDLAPAGYVPELSLCYTPRRRRMENCIACRTS